MNTLILNIPFSQHIFVYGMFLLPELLQHLKMQKLPVVIIIMALILAGNHIVGRVFLERSSYILLTDIVESSVALWSLMLIASTLHLILTYKKYDKNHISIS